MELVSDALTLAKKHQKNHEWQKAIDYYAQYMNHNKEADDTIYVSYAKCLRFAGKFDQAEQLLADGRAIHPNSEPILKELNMVYDNLYNWEAAKDIAEALIELNAEQSDHYFRLGKAYAFLNDNKNAKQTYLTGLKYKHETSFEQLIEQVKQGFKENENDFSTEYVFIDGKNNYGSFIHTNKDKKYFTKIVKNTKEAQREADFYKYVREAFPTLKTITPGYIDSQVIDNVLYLTTEMIEGQAIKAEDNVHDIISAAMKISSVQYQDIINLYPQKNYSFQLKNRPISITHFFTQIHQRYYNEKLFSGMYQLVKLKNRPTAVCQVLKQMESLIMDNQLYLFINPDRYYSLLHGDFNSTNIKLNEIDDNIQVFDWVSFTVGPHFMDVARYLSTPRIFYTQVKDAYLENDETGGKLLLIEKIFFLYALILLYIIRLKADNVEKDMNNRIQPALEELKAFVAEFNETELISSVALLREDKDECTRDTEKLKKELTDTKKQKADLEKQNQSLKKKNNDLINSKSWRMTAPLRKIIEKISNKSHKKS